MPMLSLFTWKGFYYMLHMMLPFSGLICLCLGASCDSPWRQEAVGTSTASFLQRTLTIKPDHQHFSWNSPFKDPGSQFLWQPPEGCDHQIAWLWQPVQLAFTTPTELQWSCFVLLFCFFKKSWSIVTILCQFQAYSNVICVCVYVYSFSDAFPFKVITELSIVLCLTH